MPNTVPVSVLILTKNEEGRLPDCLESVRFADEILVIDDESTDRTVEVAQRYGARVLHRKMDLEGRHRNWAAAQARNEWILSVDADERVTPELAEELRRLFRDGPQHGTYAIPRRNFIGARWVRHGGWYPSAQLKLFKRSVFRWEEASVHPRALSDASCGQLRHDLLHYSYRDLSDFVEKMNRQTTLEARKWVQDGRTVTLGKALRRAADRFFRSFISKRGYRDGVLGFVVAWFASAYQLLSYAKYVEAKQSARAASPARAPAAARS